MSGKLFLFAEEMLARSLLAIRRRSPFSLQPCFVLRLRIAREDARSKLTKCTSRRKTLENKESNGDIRFALLLQFLRSPLRFAQSPSRSSSSTFFLSHSFAAHPPIKNAARFRPPSADLQGCPRSTAEAAQREQQQQQQLASSEGALPPPPPQARPWPLTSATGARSSPRPRSSPRSSSNSNPLFSLASCKTTRSSSLGRAPRRAAEAAKLPTSRSGRSSLPRGGSGGRATGKREQEREQQQR